jgi:hypothetical protein
MDSKAPHRATPPQTANPVICSGQLSTVTRSVPSQILIAGFPELTLYRFLHVGGRFAEFLRILESAGATRLAGSPRIADRCAGTGIGTLLLRMRRERSFLFALLGLVLIEPAL